MWRSEYILLELALLPSHGSWGSNSGCQITANAFTPWAPSLVHINSFKTVLYLGLFYIINVWFRRLFCNHTLCQLQGRSRALNKAHRTPLAGTGHWGLAVYSVPTPSLTWLAPQSCFTHRGTTSWGSRVAVQGHAVVCPGLECRASAFGSCALSCYLALVSMFIKKLHFSLSVFHNAFSRCTPLFSPHPHKC